MFDNAVLAEPEMAVDPIHDGRHVLPNVAHGRESIPYIVVLPEHQIAFFTYTWVSAAGEAGAAFAVFGPGVGDAPIQQRLADRPVPADMGFDNWQIEGFSMKQDLKMDKAHLRWETPEAMVEFDFEAYHPAYAYGSDPRGCPAYCATDRIEQAGRVKGTLRIGDREIDFDAPATAITAGARATGFRSSNMNGLSGRSAPKFRSISGVSMRWEGSMCAAMSSRMG